MNNPNSFFDNVLAKIFPTKCSDKQLSGAKEFQRKTSNTFCFHVLVVKGNRHQLEDVRQFCEGYDVTVGSDLNFTKRYSAFCFASIVPLQGVYTVAMEVIEQARNRYWKCPSNAMGASLAEKDFELRYSFTTIEHSPRPIFHELVSRFPWCRFRLEYRNDRLGTVGLMVSHKGMAHFRELNRLSPAR